MSLILFVLYSLNKAVVFVLKHITGLPIAIPANQGESKCLFIESISLIIVSSITAQNPSRLQAIKQDSIY